MSSVAEIDSPAASGSGQPIKGPGYRRRSARIFLVMPVVLLMTVSFLWPLVTILLRSLNLDGMASIATGPYLGHYLEMLGDDLLRQVSFQTVLLAGVSIVISVLLAFPTAYLISRVSRRIQTLLMVLVLVPFWVSILVRLFAFTAVLGREGIINDALSLFGLGPYSLLFNTPAAVIGMVAYLTPYMILILVASMAGVDRSLTTAAHTMGASSRQAFWQIYFPQVRSALISGATLIFVLGLGFFLTPAILGGPRDLTIPVFIQQQVSIFRWGQASAAGIALLVVSLVGYFIALRIGGSKILTANQGSTGRGSSSEEVLKPTAGVVVSWFILLLTLLLLLIPLIVVVPAAFGETTQLRFPPEGFTWSWFSEVLSSESWRSSFVKSIRVGLASAVASTLLGMSLARWVSGVKSASLRSSVHVVVLAPLIVPVILLAVGVFDVQSRVGLLGTDIGLVLAHSVICVPLAFLLFANAFGRLDPSLEEAAWSMGIGRTRAFWTIVVPNVAPAALGSLLISFVTSWDEAVIALMQVGLNDTIPVRIFSLVKSGVTPAVAAVAVLLVIPVLLGVVGGIAYNSNRYRKKQRSVIVET